MVSRIRERAWMAALLGLIAGLAGGCGYHLLGQGGGLPEGVRSIGIPPIQNRTGRIEVEQRITEALIREFTLRSGLTVRGNDQNVDLLLEGEVFFYGVQPVTINPEGRATRYEITIRARVALQDLRADSLLWEDQHFIFKDQYDVDQDPDTYFDEEIIAIEIASRRFAATVVTSIMEGF